MPTEPDELLRFYEFRDFPHFIEVYAHVAPLVRTTDDIIALIVGLARDAVASNVRYAEVSVTPVAHFVAYCDQALRTELLAELDRR